MSFDRSSIYIVMTLCFVTVCALFTIKDNVMTIRMELVEVNKQMQHERDTIHLLKAELAYLGSPERLRVLNESYLKLRGTKVSQMINDPLKKDTGILLASSKIRASNVKWRYKKGPTKYLTMVSGKK